MPSPPPDGVQRLFFALWPGALTRAALARAAVGCVRGAGGRAVPPDNLHVTLAFLGAVDPERRAYLERQAGAIVVPPFTLTIDRAGYWPHNRVLWLGSSTVPSALAGLAAALARVCGACGLELERRPFQVHMTVMRRAARAPCHGPVEPVVWPVDGFALVCSDIRADRTRYRVVRTWPAAGGPQ